MRVYEVTVPAGVAPLSLVAADTFDRLERILPDAMLVAVGVARLSDEELVVLVSGQVPPLRGLVDADDDPSLERVAAAVRRAHGLPATPPAASHHGGAFDRPAHVARRIIGGGFKVRHETPYTVNTATRKAR